LKVFPVTHVFEQKNKSRAGPLNLIGTLSIFYCAEKHTTSSGPRIILTVIMYTFVYQVLTKHTIRTIYIPYVPNLTYRVQFLIVLV